MALNRIIYGKQADKTLLVDKVSELRQGADRVHQQDQAAMKLLLEREKKQAAQLQAQQEEMRSLQKQLEAQKLNEAQLRRALSLGADRLAKAQQQELMLRAEMEDQNHTIHQFELEVQDLSHRLRDEKGVGAQLKFVRTLQAPPRAPASAPTPPPRPAPHIAHAPITPGGEWQGLLPPMRPCASGCGAASVTATNTQ